VFSAGNLSVLGWVYLEQGDVAQADTSCDLAWQAMRRKPTFNPVMNPQIIANLGAVRLAQQNYAEAGKWWIKAAEGGNLHAANNAAMLYRNGEGVPRDRAIADKWAKYVTDHPLVQN